MTKAIRKFIAVVALAASALGIGGAIGVAPVHADYPCGDNNHQQASYGTIYDQWGSTNSRVTVGRPYVKWGYAGVVQDVYVDGQNGHKIWTVWLRGGVGQSQTTYFGQYALQSHVHVMWFSSQHDGATIAVAQSCAY